MAEARRAADAAATPDPDLAERTLVIERVFKAPPEKVFAAWTDPAIMVKWWGPEGFTTPRCEMEVHEGGAWTTTMVSPKGEAHTVSGVFREISPPKRLAMTWAWQQPDDARGHETTVEVTFDRIGDGTLLRLVQRLFKAAEDRDGHNGGWTSALDNLERLFA